MWNEAFAKALEDWYASPEGVFALRCKKHVVQGLISGWPRRGHTLLDVGCGTGLFLEMLWECGFDVTGLDPSPANIEWSRARLGFRAEYRIGMPAHLPFDDASVDYVSLLCSLEYLDEPGEALAEAFRVARHGVIIGFMNRWSLRGLTSRLPCFARRHCDKLPALRDFSPWQVYRLIRCLCPHARLHGRSVLPGPMRTWKDGPLWGRLNALPLPVPFGAYVAMGVDTRDQTPLTPLHLPTHERSLCLTPFAQINCSSTTLM